MENEENKNKVSSIKNGVITSPYLEVSAHSENNVNLSTQLNWGLKFRMIIADASTLNKELNIKKANRELVECVACCTNEEDIQCVRNFVCELASKGGYAEEFYANMSAFISIQNIETSKKLLDALSRLEASKLKENNEIEELNQRIDDLNAYIKKSLLGEQVNFDARYFERSLRELQSKFDDCKETLSTSQKDEIQTKLDKFNKIMRTAYEF